VAPESRPWWRCDADTDESDKLAKLPNDSAWRAWFKTMCRAKTQRRMGVFSGERHLRDLLGKHGRYVVDLVAIGVVHAWPTSCDHCSKDYARFAEPGDLVVHDYRRKQVDPTAAERQRRRYEGRGSDADARGDSHGDSHGQPHDNLTPSSRALSPSPSLSPSQDTDGADSQVAPGGSDAIAAMQFLEELTGRPFGWGPGSKVADTLIADVGELGFDRVTAEYRQVKAEASGTPIDIAGVVYGAHKRLYRIPDAPRQGKAATAPKGMVQPIDEILEAVRAQQ
jgi:hypothetical protein